MQEETIKVEENWYLTNDRYNTCMRALKENNKNINFAMDLASGKKELYVNIIKN